MSSAAAKTFRFLTSAQVIRLHQTAIAKAQPSQPGMLDSAVASPMNIKYYEKEENVFQLAADLAEKIMKNHAYQDENKRTALLAADMFLKINDYKLQKTPMAHDAVNHDITNAHVAVVTSHYRVTVGELCIRCCNKIRLDIRHKCNTRDRKDAALDAASDKWALWRFRAKGCAI